MATGGEVPGEKAQIEKDSVDSLDFLCCVCSKKGIRTEAVKYCVTCEYYYCEQCLDFHNLFPTASQHVLVGKTDFKGDGTKSKLPSIPTERCVDHPMKIVDMYCKTHDQVGCATCMATRHGESCIKFYIPESIDSLFDTEEIKRLEQQLRSTIQTVEEAINLRQGCLEDVMKMVEEAGNNIEIYADELMKSVRDLKQKTQERLNTIQKELQTVLSDQQLFLKKEVYAAKDVLEKSTRANMGSDNESQQFACSRLAAMTIQKCDEVNKKCLCPDVVEVSFQPFEASKELLKTLLDRNSLGEFSLIRSRNQSQISLYKVKENVQKSVKVKSDKLGYFIPGSCALQDGTILMADRHNRCLKRLSPCDTTVSDCLQLPGSPRSIALINQKEVAVTLQYQQEVHFIALDTTMKTTRTLKLDFVCIGITHCNNELFISDRNTVFVYTVAGNLLRQFSQGMVKETLFSDIENLAISSNSLLLFVADCDKGLIAVERESGRQVWCYTGDGLKCATGVCVDGKGVVFVCGFLSNNVLQFTESGERIGEIQTITSGFKYPLSISFISNTSTLVVTHGFSDKISILTLTDSSDMN